LTSNNRKCPLCKKECELKHFGSDERFIQCDRCGKFSYSQIDRAKGIFNEHSWIEGLPEKLYVLSGALRWESLKERSEVRLTENNIRTFLTHEPETAIKKMDEIIKFLYLRPDIAIAKDHEGGYQFDIERDYPLSFAEDPSELRYYRNILKEEGFLDSPKGRFRLTFKGFQKAEQICSNQRDSSQAFIAMWFDPKVHDANNAIHLALKETNYKPLRLDDISEKYLGNINDRMIAEIKKSGLLIADFTGNREGVYYEAGFAEGLGIPVIYTCRMDWIEKLHFDTNHLNHIDWEIPEELKQRLIDRIEATVPRKKRIV